MKIINCIFGVITIIGILIMVLVDNSIQCGIGFIMLIVGPSGIIVSYLIRWCEANAYTPK
ncbi:MAG: hypothetical protein Q8P20_02540 [bacterium]|nr:hypothetical protein [bacterium]